MFLIKEKRKHGTNLCIVQSYRDPVTKASRTKRIMNIGYLEDLKNEYDDPISHFQDVARKMSEESNANAAPKNIKLDPTKSLTPGTNLVKNFGYSALSVLYHELGLDTFFNGKQRALDVDYSLNSIMKLLVYGNILFPGSRKDIYEKKGQFFDKMDFSLNDVYHAFSYLHRYKGQLQNWTHERVREIHGRDAKQMYYYVTKHYFEIDVQNKSSREGAAKEHRNDPIVQMGLFVDKQGLPVSYELIPRSPSDALALGPALKKRASDFGIGKVILVGDNGINSADSLYNVIAGGNDYVVSQSIRNADRKMKDYVLNSEGYAPFGDECKIKSRVYTKTVRITTPSGHKKTVSYDEKQVVFYNEKYSRCARAQREDVLIKSKDLISSPGKYNKASAYDAAQYVKNIEYDKKTGQIIQNKYALYLDEEMLKEEERYDGYYLFITNRLDTSVEHIIDTFNGLWEIEDSFKYINSTYRAMPDFISRVEHMHAHFLTCFVSLMLTRILEMKTHRQYTLDQMLEGLRNCNYIHIEGNHYVQSYFDKILDHVGHSVGVDFSKRYGTLAKIKEDLGSTKKHNNLNRS